MDQKEATEIIIKYVLENFDYQWYPGPIDLYEYPDYYNFYINSKKFMETKNWLHAFVGLGPSYLSKKSGDIVQYGSASHRVYSLREFLMTEYRINIVRKKYEIERASYHYQIEIKNITDIEKAYKYIHGIWGKESENWPKESQDLFNSFTTNELEFTSVDFFGLLNLLYFNILDPFCDCSYKKLIHEYSNPFHCSNLNSFYESTTNDFFYEYMAKIVNVKYPLFEIKKNYQTVIFEIHNIDKFNQYLPTFYFEKNIKELDEQTGFTDYSLYSYDEIQEMLTKDEKSFDFVKGSELLFFIFSNTLESFCEMEIKVFPYDRD